MDENKAIQNPENTCFNCLKETIVHKIDIPALGWGSQFDNFSTEIHLCDKCMKLTNSEWWKLKTIKGETDSDGEYYEYEDEILKFVEQMPLAGQELFYNRYATGEFASFHMEAQDWIDYKLNILPHEKCKEYGLYSPQEIQAYKERFPKTLKYNTKELDSNKANLNLFPINEYLNNNMSIIGFNSDNNLMGGVNTEKMNKNVKKIKEYASFKEDWNGYGAEPFSPKLLEFSEYIIRNLKIQPEIFPTGRQSIQLEYKQDSGRYLEFEIFENSINMLYIDENGNEEIKVLENKIEEINKVVSRFYE